MQETQQPVNPDATEAAATRLADLLSAMATQIGEPSPIEAPPDAPLDEPAATPAPAAPKRKRSNGHGGARADSGRKPKARGKQASPVYAHLTPTEKRDVQARARKAKVSVSGYIRKRLGFKAVT